MRSVVGARAVVWASARAVAIAFDHVVLGAAGGTARRLSASSRPVECGAGAGQLWSTETWKPVGRPLEGHNERRFL
jgi:hypothetical protein